MVKQPKKWRKILYRQGPHADNYTHPTFLREMQTNIRARFYNYIDAMCALTLVNNGVTSITGFLIVFYVLFDDIVEPVKIVLPCFAFTIFGYIFYQGLDLRTSAIIEDIKTAIVVIVFGFIFSPLLHTLANSVSTDTIYIWTAFLLLIHMAFADYGLSVSMVSTAISLNAATFGVVCLASRLTSSYHAFALLVAGAFTFVLYPLWTERFWQPTFLIPLAVLCTYCLFLLSYIALFLYVILMLFINFVIPLIFVMQQRNKFNINGPWDEAIVEEHTDKNFDIKL